MKRSIIFLLTLAAVMITGWMGCTPNENNATGKLDFGKEVVSADQLKSIVQDEGEIAAALVTICDASGRIVLEKEPVNFYQFGASFITESLTLEVGTYQLTEFFLIDTSGDILWAAPLEGSELAHLVDRPLPLSFTIQEQKTTTVTPQVVWIGNYTPEQFGYVSFAIDFVGTFCLEVFYDSYCGMIYPDDTMYYENYESIIPPEYASRIEISGGSDNILNSFLMPELNTFRISDAYDSYTILVINCQGDTVFMEAIPKKELLAHKCEAGNPLTISDQPGYPDIIITPEGLHEPTIDQGIFGRITVPVDSSETGAYYSMPLIADLYILPAEYIDSMICYIDETGFIPSGFAYPEPLYIIRSNSDGFFELRMEEGTYMYMVQMPWGGFYIDLYLSSRQGGYIVVNQAEITKLYISIVNYYFDYTTGNMTD